MSKWEERIVTAAFAFGVLLGLAFRLAVFTAFVAFIVLVVLPAVL